VYYEIGDLYTPFQNTGFHAELIALESIGCIFMFDDILIPQTKMPWKGYLP